MDIEEDFEFEDEVIDDEFDHSDGDKTLNERATASNFGALSPHSSLKDNNDNQPLNFGESFKPATRAYSPPREQKSVSFKASLNESQNHKPEQ